MSDKITTFSRLNGQELTIIFGPSGNISSAKFRGNYVTSDLRTLRKEQCEAPLASLGFKQVWKEEKLVYNFLLQPLLSESLYIFFIDKMLSESMFFVDLSSTSITATDLWDRPMCRFGFDWSKKQFTSVLRFNECRCNITTNSLNTCLSRKG